MTIASVIGKLVEPLTSIPFPRGGHDEFQINLSRQYRPAIAPLRLLLIGSCAVLALGILWNLRQAILAYQECRILEAQLDRVRQQDLDLMAEARRDGVELSEEALKRLRFEVELVNQLLEKRTFSWTEFLTDLDRGVP